MALHLKHNQMETNLYLEKCYDKLSFYLQGFKDIILDSLVEDRGSFENNNPEYILTSEDDTELIIYIMANHYWLREWSVFLFSHLMNDQVSYETSPISLI